MTDQRLIAELANLRIEIHEHGLLLNRMNTTLNIMLQEMRRGPPVRPFMEDDE